MSKQVCSRQIAFKVHYKEYYENSFAVKAVSWMTTEGWDEIGYYQMTPERLFNRLKVLLTKGDAIISRSLDSIEVAITNPSKCFSDNCEYRRFGRSDNHLRYSFNYLNETTKCPNRIKLFCWYSLTYMVIQNDYVFLHLDSD